MPARESSASDLTILALTEVRAASAVLGGARTALGARPSRLSSVAAAAGLLGVARTRADVRHARRRGEFGADLDHARARVGSALAALDQLVASYAARPAVASLAARLAEVGLDTLLPALQPAAIPHDGPDAARHLDPVLARLRIAEKHLATAQQQLLQQR